MTPHFQFCSHEKCAQAQVSHSVSAHRTTPALVLTWRRSKWLRSSALFLMCKQLTEDSLHAQHFDSNNLVRNVSLGTTPTLR